VTQEITQQTLVIQHFRLQSYSEDLTLATQQQRHLLSYHSLLEQKNLISFTLKGLMMVNTPTTSTRYQLQM
jgi:hypothetical protein